QVKFVLLAFAKQRMEAPPYTILRNDLETRRSFSPVAAKAKSPEHRIVCENGCGGAKRATVTKIYLARVVPGPSMMRLIEPRLAVGRRLKAAAAEDVRRGLRLHEALGVLNGDAGLVFACLVCMREIVTCEGVRGLEARGIESVLGLK